MDEKTEELRDIFVEVTEEETVTESQTERRGSLLRDVPVDERIEGTIEKMRDRFSFQTDLDDHALSVVVRRFYDGESDDAIAAELNVPPETVFTARMDLHLVRDGDSAGVDLSALRERRAEGENVEALADAFEVEPARIERAMAALDAEERAQRVSQRFRTEFEEALTDADIAVRLTADTQDDGLEDATEGMEVDVDF